MRKKLGKDIFYVAAIPDTSQIVITGGSHDGLAIGDILEIRGKSTPIKDPHTGEVLGNLPINKGTVRITEIQDRLSVCTNAAPAISPLVASISGMFASIPDLNIEESQLMNRSTKEYKIRVGDTVYYSYTPDQESENGSENKQTIEL